MLELGCGTGHVLDQLARRDPGLRLVGSELYAEGLAPARARLGPRAALVQHDARRAPFRPAFDVVGAFDVLEHVEEDHDVLAQSHRVLRPGGLLLLTVPQHRWLWSAADVHAQHVRRYTRRSLHAVVTGAGFEVLTSTSFVSLLLPVMLGSRLLRRSQDDPLAELRLPRWLNAGLGTVMSIERAAVRRGVRLPVGGSRLVAARRL